MHSISGGLFYALNFALFTYFMLPAESAVVVGDGVCCCDLQSWCPVRARGGDMSAAAVCTHQDTAVPIEIVSAYISCNPELLSLSPRQ